MSFQVLAGGKNIPSPKVTTLRALIYNSILAGFNTEQSCRHLADVFFQTSASPTKSEKAQANKLITDLIGRRSINTWVKQLIETIAVYVNRTYTDEVLTQPTEMSYAVVQGPDIDPVYGSHLGYQSVEFTHSISIGSIDRLAFLNIGATVTGQGTSYTHKVNTFLASVTDPEKVRRQALAAYINFFELTDTLYNGYWLIDKGIPSDDRQAVGLARRNIGELIHRRVIDRLQATGHIVYDHKKCSITRTIIKDCREDNSSLIFALSGSFVSAQESELIESQQILSISLLNYYANEVSTKFFDDLGLGKMVYTTADLRQAYIDLDGFVARVTRDIVERFDRIKAIKETMSLT